MKRLFFALWPKQQTRQKCAELIDRLGLNQFRPVAANNLHVTLVFLGNTNSNQQAALIKAADLLKPPKLSLTFDQLNFWKKPAVLCLTPSRFDDNITELSAELVRIAKLNQIECDDRPYQPHVTLARKAKPVNNIEFEPIIWPADEFCLVESCSTKQGSIYQVIQRWPNENHPEDLPYAVFKT